MLQAMEVPSQSTSAAVQMLLQVVFEVGDGIAGTGNFMPDAFILTTKPAGAIPTSTSTPGRSLFVRRSRRAKTPRPQGNNQRNTRPEWRFTFAFFLLRSSGMR